MTQLVRVRVRSDFLRVLASGASRHCCSVCFHRDLIPPERRAQLSEPFICWYESRSENFCS